MTIEKYNGLVAAPFTPMDKNGNLDPGLIPEYYSYLEKNGVIGAFINGSTGEGPSLTHSERRLQALKWIECFKAGGKVRIINLIGGTSYMECIENAIFSYESGMSAVAMVAPYYYKPEDEASLAEFVAKVGSAVPQMPVYFYHIPGLTGVNMPMFGFLTKISAMLPNFAGIKYSHENLEDFFTCLNYQDGRYDFLWGTDQCMLSALVLGCRGYIGSTYNYAAPLYHMLIEAFDEGNLAKARRLQKLSVEMVSLLGKYGGQGTGKAFMKYAGFDLGNFRIPLNSLTEEAYMKFVEDVKSLKMDHLFSVR